MLPTRTVDGIGATPSTPAAVQTQRPRAGADTARGPCVAQPFCSVVAPVMIATASVGVWDFGVMTPAQPPSRAM